MHEEWRSVVGYEGVYSVSSRGRVRRELGGRGSTSGRILTCKVAPNRYLHVDLSFRDRKRRYLIHRLVAMAFIGTPPNGDSVVNHLNGEKSDNRVANLEWCTVAENNRHAHRTGLAKSRPLRGEQNGRAILSSEQVSAIRRLKGIVGARDLALLTGVCRSAIQRIHQMKNWPDLRIREMPS